MKEAVSYYRVESETKYKKIGDNHLGESFLEGMTALLNCKEGLTNNVLQNCLMNGNYVNSDLTVEDIYGHKVESLGLPRTLLASSMGKISKFGPPEKYNINDILTSLVSAIAINQAQIACLFARQENVNNLIIVHQKFENQYFNGLF